MKRKRELTRRQRALRRLAIAVLVLVVMNYVGTYGLTPGHALRLAEGAMDCGRTRVIKDLGTAPLERTDWHRLYLSANDRAVLFAAAYSPSHGWEARPSYCIDCTADAPAHGALCRLYSWWTKEPEDPEERKDPLNWQYYDEVWYLFGRVDDPRADRVRGRMLYQSYQREGEEAVVLAEVDSERWEWIEKDGEHYFFFQLMARGPAIPEETRGKYIYQYQLLDREGAVLYEDEKLDGAMVNLSRGSWK